jgi:hypothetical protein
MPADEAKRIGILWAGDPYAPVNVTPEECRLHRVFDALREQDVIAEPVIYADEVADEVSKRLIVLDGVLVWVNPIENGRDRSVLDAILRKVATVGVFVSAHPDVILKMGTKQVLYQTRNIGWGCDTHVYMTADELREQLPTRLADGKARVLKQYRGHSGNGVWKVQLARPASKLGPDVVVRARHALRGATETEITFVEFVERMLPYFEHAGRIVDQAYQERLTEGMMRCYLVHDKVVGFGHQAINALFPAPAGEPPATAPPPGPRLYSGPTDARFQSLKRQLESEWLSAMQRVLDIETSSLPVIWDADFLCGPKTASGDDTFVLCEINVSSVYPFPEEALTPLAKAAAAAIKRVER